MRHLFAIALTALLCTACSSESEPAKSQCWFKTYQTDRTCQTARPPVHDADIHGPTGRAHPF